MKKILIGVILTFVYSSCQKTYCWKCAITHINSGSIYTQDTSLCDKTQSDITAFQNANTITQKVGDQTNYIEETKCSH